MLAVSSLKRVLAVSSLKRVLAVSSPRVLAVSSQRVLAVSCWRWSWPLAAERRKWRQFDRKSHRTGVFGMWEDVNHCESFF